MPLPRLQVLALAAGAILWPPADVAQAQSQARPPLAMAILDFDYRDTSGESQDATVAHQARLTAFMASIRRDLAASGRYRLVDLSCSGKTCSASSGAPSDLFGLARRSGADLLLFGGFHKESTLVQWAKVQVVDLAADKLVVDRLLTFRGDNDDSWRRAESFLIEELNSELPTSGRP
jgi:hypothetical protein